MRILHTSDWHLGHRLHEQSQSEEHHLFLSWLITTINDQKIDLLLIAGDIFDTGVPSTQSQKMYYDFLIDLRKTSCKQVVITAGNHDAPGTINAPKALLSALSVHVIGKASDNINDEIFTLNINNEEVIIGAVPYLRDQDIRKAISGEAIDEIGDRYKKALTNHYHELAEACATINKNNAPVIAMGHLFAIGGSSSDSEQSIYVGNLGDIGVDDFPKTLDYIALGHLHRPQKVGKLDHIRYSGSPIILSFSEINYEKTVTIIDLAHNKIESIATLSIPRFRSVQKIFGSCEACIKQLQIINNEKHALCPWIEVVIEPNNTTINAFTTISQAAENLNLEVLKVSFKNDRENTGIEHLTEHNQHVETLLPMDVFKMKCKEQEFDIDDYPEIMDAFNEAVQLAQEN